MKIDFKKFKKISSDAKSTQLKHPDGHTVTIAHAPLTPKNMSELKALPTYDDGGTVTPPKPTPPPEPNKKNAAAVSKGASSGGPTWEQGVANMKNAFGFADGGAVPEQDSEQSAYNPEDYIPVPKALLQQHIQNLQAMDAPMEGPSTDPMDFVGPGEVAGVAKAAVPLFGMAKAAGNAVAKEGVETAGKGLLSAFQREVANLGEKTAAKAVTFQEKAAAAKEAQELAEHMGGKMSATVGDAVDQGIIGGPEYAAKIAFLKKNKGGYAQGGDVKQSNPKLEESKKQPPKPKFAAGGILDPFADASAAVLQPDTAEQIQADAQAAPVDPQIQARRNAYNEMAQGMGPEVLFGPNGEAPAHFKTDLWPAAEALVSKREQDATTADTQAAKGVAEEDYMRQRAGLSPQAPMPSSPPTGDAVASSDEQEADEQRAPAQMNGLQDQQIAPPSMEHAYAEGQQAKKNEADAIQAEGDANAVAYQKAVDQSARAIKATKSAFDTYDDARKKYQTAIEKGQIDPSKYWDSHSRVNTAIGLMLGGLASYHIGGPNGPNQVIQVVQNAMDREMQAQKANLGSKENLLAATSHHFKNALEAQDMARVFMNDNVKNMIATNASRAQGPIAQARAQGLMSALESDTAMRMGRLSAASGLRQLAGSGDEGAYKVAMNNAQMMAPDVFKDQQAKYIPGTGVASVPVSSKDREALEGFNALNRRLDQAISFQHDVAGRTGTWTPEHSALANNLKNSIWVEMNKLTGLTRLNEHEANNYKEQVGNIGGINAGGTLAKLKDIKSQINMNRSSMLNSLGVTPFKGAEAQNGAAPQIKTVNGVKYMRGPNGEAVKVQ